MTIHNKSFDEISGNNWRRIRNTQSNNEEEHNLCGAFENNFDARGIDYQSLAEDIRQNINGLNGFYFDYTRYALEDSVSTSFQGSMGTPVMTTFKNDKPFDYKDSTGKTQKGTFELGRLNKRICYVTEYNIGVNLEGKNVYYSIDFIYKGAENAINPIESTPENDFTRNDKYKAIMLSGKNINHFLGFISTVYGSSSADACKNNIINRYKTFFTKYNHDVSILKSLYEQVPDYAVIKDDSLLLEHLKLLMDYDDVGILSGWKDSSNAIIKILKNISDKQNLYDWLYKNPATILRLYRNLDGETHEDFLRVNITNKEFFCMLLTGLAGVYSKNKAAIEDFTIGKSFKVDSDIDDQGIIGAINPLNWFSDPKEKVFLQQQKEITTSHYSYGRGGVRVLVEDTSTEDLEEGNYFHPLEIVSLIDEDSGEAQKVPAIYVKMLADKASWEHIIKVIVVSALILTIVISAGTLTAGGLTVAGTVVAIADLTVATVELGLMYIPECPEKDWFLKYWQPLSIAVGIGSISVLLRESLLKNGPKLLARLSKARNMADAAKIIELIKKAYTFVEVEMIVAGQRIICKLENPAAITKILGSLLAKKMDKYGLFLTKDIILDQRLLVYNGEKVVMGNLKTIKKRLREIFAFDNNESSILNSLDELINTTGKAALGESRFSIKALEKRLELTDNFHSGNIAVFEFENKAGKLEVKAFTTLTDDELKALGRFDKPHAEQLGFEWLEKNNIKKVKAIYSELEPCSIKKVNCKNEIMKKFPDAKVSYSFDYTSNPAIMKQALELRKAKLKELIKFR